VTTGTACRFFGSFGTPAAIAASTTFVGPIFWVTSTNAVLIDCSVA